LIPGVFGNRVPPVQAGLRVETGGSLARAGVARRRIGLSLKRNLVVVLRVWLEMYPERLVEPLHWEARWVRA
jgi:hypothetical protein